MTFTEDSRIVLTLDAGGTSFRFNALRGGRALLDPPISLPSRSDDLDASLEQILRGFDVALDAAGREAVALSFAFPAPADYTNGIIGDLPNLIGFRGGVALGPMLEAHFGLPVFINNDGALFAYGESLGGLLPWVNNHLEAAGNTRRFHNLLGFTFGTGFGGGVVVNDHMVRGDNSAAGQICKLRHRDERRCFAEEGVSIRALRHSYAEAAGIAPESAPEPKDIAAIAIGDKPGDAAAARQVFERFGRVAGDAIAHALTLIDGLVVLGGGISGAAGLFLPALLGELNSKLEWLDGTPTDRLLMRVIDLEGPAGMTALVRSGGKQVPVRGTKRTVSYEPEMRTGLGLTRLGTTAATMLGAYAFALDQIDRR